MEHITLYLKDDNSDKVYQVAMEPVDLGYMVLFAYGRKGAKLTRGSKPEYPVAEDEARADWKEGDATPIAPTIFPTKLLPLTDNGLVVRTDFSDDAGWEKLKSEILEPNADLDDLVADVHFVDDRCFEGGSAEQLASAVHNGHEAWFLFVADRFTFTHPDHPVLAVDCEYEPGLACRILPKLVGITEVQISEQNADYDECTDGAAWDGIVRD